MSSKQRIPIRADDCLITDLVGPSQWGYNPGAHILIVESYPAQ